MKNSELVLTVMGTGLEAVLCLLLSTCKSLVYRQLERVTTLEKGYKFGAKPLYLEKENI